MTSANDRSVSSQYWRRTAASIPSVNSRDHIEQALRAYIQSWGSNDVVTRVALFADDVVFEDPATVVRAAERAELLAFFSAAIPSDWALQFAFDRVVVVGDEAVLTYTVQLAIADRKNSQLLVNSHVRFDASGLISAMRVFYDADSVTDAITDSVVAD